MEENNIKIEDVIKTLKEENHRLEVENEELKDVFLKVLRLFNNDKESFFKAIKVETINNTVNNNKQHNATNKDYHLIDLGLPSGTLLMDRYVGANSTEDAGLYFAWGETTGYTADEVGKTKQFSWNDYKFEDSLTKYNSTDGLTKLDTKDDAILQNTHKFRLPTKKQLQELLDNTISTWVAQNGVNGRLFTSKTNGNSIFVPAAGGGNGGLMGDVGSGGFLWSSSLYGDNANDAWGLYFNSYDAYLLNGNRCYGLSVRGISTK